MLNHKATRSVHRKLYEQGIQRNLGELRPRFVRKPCRIGGPTELATITNRPHWVAKLVAPVYSQIAGYQFAGRQFTSSKPGRTEGTKE